SFVLNYTNAATIVSDEFKDAEDLDGVFSGLKEYTEKITEWPLNAFLGQYDNKSWQYATPEGGQAGSGWKANTQQSGEHAAADERGSGQRGAPAQPGGGNAPSKAAPHGPPFEPLVKGLLKAPARRDPTLADPRCVFQIVKRHFARYTPEMVERVTGCPRDTFVKVAETL